MDVGEEDEQADRLLLLGQPELGGLLHRIDGVAAGIGQRHDPRAGALRLEDEGGEVRALERRQRAAKHLAAVGLHHLGRVALQRMAEGVIRRQEVPGIAALLDHGAAVPLASAQVS